MNYEADQIMRVVDFHNQFEEDGYENLLHLKIFGFNGADCKSTNQLCITKDQAIAIAKILDTKSIKTEIFGTLNYCPSCNGTGNMESDIYKFCPNCDGTGFEEPRYKFKIKKP